MEIVVVEFAGGIDEFPSLIQTVDGLIDGGERRLVLDIPGLAFINSAALGYLIKALKNLEDQDGELALARVQPAIRNVLHVTNLEGLFPTFEDVEEAVVYLGGDPKTPSAPGKRRVRRTGVRGSSG